MINILSYIGMNVQSEVCLWTLLGLIRTIFDATLFRVNANLKQVWQMSMPEELSMPVQRVLRTMISGVMLVQCFTVYVYLASYIVLLYPVFLEERPTLVLPWLLLAAIRQLLCELTSLALGLGTCVLLGPTRPPCIKFVIIKLISIMPAFYMWMLLFSYYHSLKVSAAFKTFPAVMPPGDQDYGLELAIRRRRTKSLLGEDQLRSKLVASLYGETRSSHGLAAKLSKGRLCSHMLHGTDTSSIEETEEEALRPHSLISNRMSETGYEDWFGSEVVLPRGCDRILEQFVLMLMRIRVYLDKQGQGVQDFSSVTSKCSHPTLATCNNNLTNATISEDDVDTSFLVGSNKGKTASYLQEYPQIFMKKSADVPRSEISSVQNRNPSEDDGNTLKVPKTRKRTVTVSSKDKIVEDEEPVTNTKHTSLENTTRQRDFTQQSTSKQASNNFEETKANQKDNKISENYDDNNPQDGQIVYERRPSHPEMKKSSSNQKNVENENSSTSSSNETLVNDKVKNKK